MLSAVEAGHRLASSGEDYQGAVRIKDKDLVRSLAQAMEEKDPWVLFSRPVEWSAGFVDQHFGTRASERRTRKTSYILLGTAVLSGLVFLLFGAGINGAAAAAASVLCMGAPLSSTLVAAVAALRLQRTAAAAGAVVPGWAATEELGGIDTVQLDADDLFGPDSVNLEDIRIFKGGRIDRDILYTASVLNQSCNTLRGLFRQMIEDRTDILFPVKDLETHRGLGFAAWCDNNRILLGNRAYLEQEGVPLPEPEYEAKHSQNGALQDPVPGGVRQPARHVCAALCGRAQYRPCPGRASAGEYPPDGRLPGPQPDRPPYCGGIPPAAGDGDGAGTGAVGRIGICSRLHQCGLLHDAPQGSGQPDRRPGGGGDCAVRRDQRYDRAAGIGVAVGGHCTAADYGGQHRRAVGGSGADVPGRMERIEHCRLCIQERTVTLGRMLAALNKKFSAGLCICTGQFLCGTQTECPLPGPEALAGGVFLQKGGAGQACASICAREG